MKCFFILSEAATGGVPLKKVLKIFHRKAPVFGVKF